VCQPLARKSGLKIYFLWWYLSLLGQGETTGHSASISSTLIEERAQECDAHQRVCHFEFRQEHTLNVRAFIIICVEAFVRT
jgi:hypothetical protein